MVRQPGSYGPINTPVRRFIVGYSLLRMVVATRKAALNEADDGSHVSKGCGLGEGVLIACEPVCSRCEMANEF
ncbi:hypothetical protein GCM10011358_34770 [Sinisalibacter lacisalsi]|uniref:Uncharacterized protein n=1 Tax=Sinisalibacter lacisalsi TaxID=1526570 RepID=A0ABQ1QY46_9RHOB|nr:hypothetical protein GCM10011358_34770 [Sinisalibacter lacisalsi]